MLLATNLILSPDAPLNRLAQPLRVNLAQRLGHLPAPEAHADAGVLNKLVWLIFI